MYTLKKLSALKVWYELLEWFWWTSGHSITDELGCLHLSLTNAPLGACPPISFQLERVFSKQGQRIGLQPPSEQTVCFLAISLHADVTYNTFFALLCHRHSCTWKINLINKPFFKNKSLKKLKCWSGFFPQSSSPMAAVFAENFKMNIKPPWPVAVEYFVFMPHFEH